MQCIHFTNALSLMYEIAEFLHSVIQLKFFCVGKYGLNVIGFLVLLEGVDHQSNPGVYISD